MTEPNENPEQEGEISDEELEEILQQIRDMADQGATRSQIKRAWVDAGTPEDVATELVNAALGKPGSAGARRRRMSAAEAREEGGGGGGRGWLIFIGLLLLVNLLSYLFDWPFWVY